MIRQLGPPHVFFTKSVHETGMLHLIQALRQKDENRIITEQEVTQMSKAERNKIIKKYPIDVVNHLDALFRHIILGLKKKMSLGQYHIEDYFYRVEFQQRGSAHIHCLFWLGLNNGKPPPQLDMESLQQETQDDKDRRFIDYFNSIICASSTYEDLSKDEIYFQRHSHKISCYKTNKGIKNITPDEGFGMNPNGWLGDPHEVQKCRHNFPKFPVPETTILRKYNDQELQDVECMRIQRKTLNMIEQYILRNTKEETEHFENLTFNKMLEEIGISKDEYLMALRGTVKISFQFLPKRECRDVFINNYNPQLLKDDPSNHDIQIIAGEQGAFAVGCYIAKYISKEEAGQSNLLKGIEEESAKKGESTDMKLKKLAKVLEDTREVSMQEIIYRLFGYSMCSASRKCKFIQTQPPEQRDGLMKPNIENLKEDESIFFPNIIEYYQNRPESLEGISLAHFAAYYEYFQKKKEKGKDDNVKEDDNIDEVDAINEGNYIQLNNNMGFIRRRRKAAIIRYFRNNKEDQEQHIKTTMLLFYPL